MRFRFWKYQIRVVVDYLADNVVGIRSDCDKQKNVHVLFLDFDKTKYSVIRNKLKKMQKKYDLGTAYIFRSSKGNFHAIILTKLLVGEIAQVHWELGMKHYLLQSFRRDFWVLRIGSKDIKGSPIYYGAIINKCDRLCSYAHFLYLERMHDILSYGQHFDRNSKLGLIVYRPIIYRRKRLYSRK